VHGAGLEDERCLLIGLEATAAALLEDERHPLGLGPLLLPPLQAGAAVVPCLGCCREPCRAVEKKELGARLSLRS
jgi:hypothetical protein